MNPIIDHPRLVVGYHGCDRSTADRVLRGGALTPSQNPWDWLGHGIYFWEQSIERAWEFAHEQQRRGKLTTPAVLGAYLHLGRCFDLTDRWATQQLGDWYSRCNGTMQKLGKALPTNRPALRGDHDLLLRNLDCTVLNFAMQGIDVREGRLHFQTVRGVFVEGDPAFPGSRIHGKTHVQVAVRDPSVVLGYFLPTYTPAWSQP